MDYLAAAEALARRELLEKIYDRMTDDEKRLFVQMAMQQKSTRDIMAALESQSAQLARLQQTQQTFSQDFLSNILGNVAYGGAAWLLGRLARLIR